MTCLQYDHTYYRERIGMQVSIPPAIPPLNNIVQILNKLSPDARKMVLKLCEDADNESVSDQHISP